MSQYGGQDLFIILQEDCTFLYFSPHSSKIPTIGYLQRQAKDVLDHSSLLIWLILPIKFK